MLKLPVVILAAGASTRMGRPKALLPLRGRSFIQGIIENYQELGYGPIFVVVGAHAQEVIKDIYYLDVEVAMNENFADGQLSSILTGIDAVEPLAPEAVILHPVDHPLIKRETVAALVDAFGQSGKSIAIPLFEGKRGHPVIFAATLFGELKKAKPDVGARQVVWNRADEICEVPVPDPGVLMNIDTPESYENLSRNM